MAMGFRLRLVIDGQTNAALSRFGGIVQVPLGPFDRNVSTFKMYVDGRLVTLNDYPYRVGLPADNPGEVVLGSRFGFFAAGCIRT